MLNATLTCHHWGSRCAAGSVQLWAFFGLDRGNGTTDILPKPEPSAPTSQPLLAHGWWWVAGGHHHDTGTALVWLTSRVMRVQPRRCYIRPLASLTVLRRALFFMRTQGRETGPGKADKGTYRI